MATGDGRPGFPAHQVPGYRTPTNGRLPDRSERCDSAAAGAPRGRSEPTGTVLLVLLRPSTVSPLLGVPASCLVAFVVLDLVGAVGRAGVAPAEVAG